MRRPAIDSDLLVMFAAVATVLALLWWVAATMGAARERLTAAPTTAQVTVTLLRTDAEELACVREGGALERTTGLQYESRTVCVRAAR